MEPYSLYPNVQIPNVAFGKFILQSILTYGDKLAWIDIGNGSEEYTFSRIYNETCKCANSLIKEGIKRGDIVGILCPNSCQQKILVLALALCGATIVPINNFYTEDEVKRQMQIVQPTVVFTTSDQITKLQTYSENIKIYKFGPNEEDNTFFEFLKGSSGQDFLEVDIDVQYDDLFLLCSSGTTGPPKLIQLTNYSVVAMMHLMRFPLKCSRNSVACSVSPMFHIASIALIFTYLIQGCVHVLPAAFNLKELLQTVQKYRVTHLPLLSPYLVDIAKSDLVEQSNVSSLVQIVTGSSPLSEEVKQLVKKKLNCMILIEVYGLTEAAIITFCDQILSKSGSVGYLIPNINLKVVGVETREKLKASEKGEIMVKGPVLAKGYFKNPEATKNLFDDEGWLKTGDMGYFDEDGNIFITDRIKDVIKSVGVQVSPSEIEAILMQHPKISDVGVIGVPDSVGYLCEVPKAFIVKKDPSLTVDDVHELIQDKLADYKQLRGGVVFVDELPRSGSGKILKQYLRKIALNI